MMLLIGLLLAGGGAALFLWGSTADLGTDAAEALRRIGQVSGAVGGVGGVLLVLALVLRSRGR
jgi:hypothetical protein